MVEQKPKSLVMDFGCCLPFGHNLHSVILCAEREAKGGRDTKALVCKQVGANREAQHEYLRYPLPALYTDLLVDAEEQWFRRNLYKIENYIMNFRMGSRSINDIRAEHAVKSVLDEYTFSQSDRIIFPSADFYGVRACIQYFRKRKEEHRPRVHLRFIGVLEIRRGMFHNSLLSLIKLINENASWISVSAEVDTYAQYLNSVLPNTTVVAEPYPYMGKTSDTDRRGEDPQPFTVLLPGSNRVDKGYFDLFNLCKEVFFSYPGITFIIQDMKRWDANFSRKYQRKLSRLANVELVDAVLPRDKIEELYSRADLILLPYDPISYHYRGSANHYEAIVHKIPVLARQGAGFIGEIEKWSSGWTYETKKELLEQLGAIQKMDKVSVEQKMENAVRAFRESSHEAISFNLS